MAVRADAAVERLQVAVYDIPTDAPEGDGTFAWTSTTLVLVHAFGGGRTGLGYTYASAACRPLIEGLLAPAVTGVDVFDVPAAQAAMARAVRNVGRAGIAGTALAAVEAALWDLKARLLDLPVSRLLGRARPDVPIYGSGGFTTYDDAQTREQLSHWVHDLGILRVKIKIGESWGTRADRDLARIALARSVIGPDAELYVDANGGYTRGQVVRVAAAMTDSDVRWFEEPVSSDDLTGLAGIRTRVRPDVAAGEYGYDLGYFERMVSADAVDCLQADVTRCGVTDWLRAPAVAAAHHLQISGHCAPALHAQVAAAVPNLRHLEYFHDHVRIESMLFDGTLSPAGGTLTPDDGRPGFGLELKAADAERFRVG